MFENKVTMLLRRWSDSARKSEQLWCEVPIHLTENDELMAKNEQLKTLLCAE